MDKRTGGANLCCQENNVIKLPNNSYTFTEIPDFVSVGSYSSIGGGVKFYAVFHQHLCVIDRKCVYTMNWDQPTEAGKIEIGSDCWIGEDVKIMANSKIGDGCIIGAGSILHGDVPDYTIAYGNPARPRRRRFSEWEIDKLREIKWWTWKPEVIKERLEDLKNIDLFLKKYG